MRPRFQFSTRRLVLATALVAAGCGMRHYFGIISTELQEIYSVAVWVSIFALPAAGVGVLVNRSLVLGLYVGALLGCNLSVVVAEAILYFYD